MKFATKPVQQYPPHLIGMLLHYLEKLKIQIFSDIQHMWKKMQTNCILSAPILIPICM